MTRAKSKRVSRRKSTPRETPKKKPPIAKTKSAPKPKVEQPGPPPAALADFKTPPTDPLEANAELHRMLVISAYDAATDEGISPRERRKEIRTITASAAKLMPDARRWQAEQLIKEDRRELEKKASEKRGAKLEPRPAGVMSHRLPKRDGAK